MSIPSTLRRNYIRYSLSKKVSAMEQTKNTDTRATNKNSSQANHPNFRCGINRGTFRTNRGLLQHLNFCRR